MAWASWTPLQITQRGKMVEVSTYGQLGRPQTENALRLTPSPGVQEGSGGFRHRGT